ncbi:MAG: right-handed parallel beta-helix repeat-containing protein [Spartobacteria bacterium]|nr:right-handed parallel beta-helix repeat-containing protein [Spartobacteria bacterium]
MKQNTGWKMLLAALSFLTAQSLWAQGPLEPPDAPAPTMKSLNQIEARTPITNLPCVISQSGSYYLIGDLVCSGNNYGIFITNTAKSVTLDLNGFTLTGPGATGFSAIHVGHGDAELTLRNGYIRNWNGNTAYAVYSTGMEAVRMADIVVENCANGIKVYNGMVENCRVYNCITPSGNFFGISGSSVVVINCVISDCESSGGTAYGYQLGYGSIARNCIAQNLTGGGATKSYGFQGQKGTIIESCVARKCYRGIYTYDQSLVRNNLSVENESHGLLVGYGGSRVEGNNLIKNGGHGLYGSYNSNNLIIANSASLNTNANYYINNGSYGPVSGAPASPTAEVTNHPWANFSY